MIKINKFTSLSNAIKLISLDIGDKGKNGFSQKYTFQGEDEALLLVTFDIIISLICPENLIEIPHVVQKI